VALSVRRVRNGAPLRELMLYAIDRPLLIVPAAGG
jgi:hypothetical protein